MKEIIVNMEFLSNFAVLWFTISPYRRSD